MKTTQQLRKCHIHYHDYGKKKLKIFGEYHARVTHRGVTKNITFVVADSDNPLLLGRTFLRAFGYVLCQVNSIDFAKNNSVIIDQIKRDFASHD